MKSKETFDIIILATARINNPYSSTAVSLANEFSKKHRVFFIENPFTIKDILFDRNAKNHNEHMWSSKYSTQVNTNLWKINTPSVLSINWLSEGVVYDFLAKINERIFFSTVKKMLYDFKIKDFILLNIFNPYYFTKSPGWFTPALRIYYSVDSMSDTKYFSKHGVPKEVEILKQYDLAFATSKNLLDNISKYNKNAYYLPNAADYELFSSTVTNDLPIPDDLKGVPQPRVVYVGNIDFRIDIQLLLKLVKEYPQLNIVFIGPVGSKDIEKIKNENFYFLGSKKTSDLPSYLKYCQCAIIPFLKNGFTKSIYPLKINEYLAAGLPTVTTSFSNSMDEFTEVVEISDSPESFVNSVVDSIDKNSSTFVKQRQIFAFRNSWESRSKNFLEIVNSSLGG